MPWIRLYIILSVYFSFELHKLPQQNIWLHEDADYCAFVFFSCRISHTSNSWGFVANFIPI